jgi:GT2 family glycosyltransferase
MHNISLLIGLKNNLEYTKYFYKTTRDLYPSIELCFVSYGSTDGTHEWLDSLNDSFVKIFYSNESKTLSDTYNKAAEISTKEYVVFLHNDIVLSQNFIENLEKFSARDIIISYTTIEPPIFAGHERPGKIIKDFGVDIESFDIHGMYEFSNNLQKDNLGIIDGDITFFMCISRETLIKIGGLDNLYSPMFCEDDDLIKRLGLLNLRFSTSLNSICYHFVSKTSRFSKEYESKTKQIEYKSNLNFIRKWGHRNSKVKYDIGYVVNNCGVQHLASLEPLCDTIYLRDELDLIIPEYISTEQKNTKFDLSKKVKQLYTNKPSNNIIVEIDARELDQRLFNLLLMLPEIIKESGEVGEFQLDGLKVTINSMETYEDRLVNLSDEYYTNKLL